MCNTGAAVVVVAAVLVVGATVEGDSDDELDGADDAVPGSEDADDTESLPAFEQAPSMRPTTSNETTRARMTSL
jgi:hypothetical protein